MLCVDRGVWQKQNVYLNYKKFLLKKTDINIYKKELYENNTKIGQKKR